MRRVELFGVTPQPSGGHSGSQITLSNLLTLLITPQLPTKRVLAFQHPVLALFADWAMCSFLLPRGQEAASLLASDRSDPLLEFLESFVSGMLGTLIRGRLCISVTGPLFPLEGCELLNSRGLWVSLPGGGLAPFSGSP